MKLHDFQQECVEQLMEGFRKQRTQCLAWYTGAGKTNVFIEMCRKYIEQNPNIRIGISAYLTNEIREQVAERLELFGLKDVTCVIRHGEPIVPFKNIYVFNPQSLYNKDTNIEFDVLIIDESHSGMDEGTIMLNSILKHMCTPETKTLLVSATPWDTLAMKVFKNCPVFKRTLDQGLKDGLVTDFEFHAEEAMITFTEKDFNRSGDLGRGAAQRQRAILKSACIGKMEYLIKTYDKELGHKCVVICPPGNFSEIARSMAERFGGLAYLQDHRLNEDGLSGYRARPQEILESFKSDKTMRFLFVVRKCQVGFDMAELSSVVDLTMSRNIKVLAQRAGRIARKNGTQRKHYFYVYDQSLMRDRLEWLVATMIDFCLGAYDGWTTKTAKYYKPKLRSSWQRREPFSTTLTEIVSALKGDGLIRNERTLRWVTQSGPPTFWTIERARAEAAKWSSRTEMWQRQPALYKWFRLNAKDEMDRIFPLKNQRGKWNEQTVVDLMKKHTGKMGRKQFREKFGGLDYWIYKNKRTDLYDVYFPSQLKRWTDESVTEAISSLSRWSDIRKNGLRSWMQKRQGERYWKAKWFQMRTPARASKRRKSA